jgi:hypothetical protein
MLIVCSNFKFQTKKQTNEWTDGRTDKRIQNDFSEVRKTNDFKQIMKRKKERKKERKTVEIRLTNH